MLVRMRFTEALCTTYADNFCNSLPMVSILVMYSSQLEQPVSRVRATAIV